jgi:hypothetical protein
MIHVGLCVYPYLIFIPIRKVILNQLEDQSRARKLSLERVSILRYMSRLNELGINLGIDPETYITHRQQLSKSGSHDDGRPPGFRDELNQEDDSRKRTIAGKTNKDTRFRSL